MTRIFTCAQVVGKTLLDCVSCEPCEWVVARALDALYDVFGADECPIQVFSTLQIMPILEKASSQLHSRVSILMCSIISIYVAYTIMICHFMDYKYIHV